MEDSPKLRSLGKYRLIASLGRGGMADVYLSLVAGPGGFNKLIVLKVLREDLVLGSDESVLMFWDEARLAAQLVHPNIVHSYEAGEAAGRYFLAMEYLDGQSYRTVLNRTRDARLPLHEELRILSEVARGLHYSHELRSFDGEPLHVVHRDVGPQNVFITYDGQVKLLDFGIAKTLQDEHKTQHGMVKGKLDYIAPEQLRGSPVDRRADIFALGAMLWETVTGQRFAGGRKVYDGMKVHTRVTGGEPKAREVHPNIAEELAVIIDRSIALDPEDRYPDAETFANALDSFIATSGRKPSAPGLSRIVSALFEAEQKKMHVLIDQQMKAIKRDAAGFTEHPEEIPLLSRTDTVSSSTLWPQRDAGLVTSDALPAPALMPRRLGPRPLWVFATLVLAAGAVGLLMLPRSMEHQTSASPATLPPTAATIAPPAPPPPAAPDAAVAIDREASLLLRVSVTPAEALVTLDQTPLAPPFSGSFRKDGVLHPLRATAPGYRPYKHFITFDRDQTIQIALEPAPVGPRRPRRADEGNPPPPAEAPGDAQAQPTAAPARPALPAVRPRGPHVDIDTVDPYAAPK